MTVSNINMFELPSKAHWADLDNNTSLNYLDILSEEMTDYRLSVLLTQMFALPQHNQLANLGKILDEAWSNGANNKISKAIGFMLAKQESLAAVMQLLSLPMLTSTRIEAILEPLSKQQILVLVFNAKKTNLPLFLKMTNVLHQLSQRDIDAPLNDLQYQLENIYVFAPSLNDPINSQFFVKHPDAFITVLSNAKSILSFLDGGEVGAEAATWRIAGAVKVSADGLIQLIIPDSEEQITGQARQGINQGMHYFLEFAPYSNGTQELIKLFENLQEKKPSTSAKKETQTDREFEKCLQTTSVSEENHNSFENCITSTMTNKQEYLDLQIHGGQLKKQLRQAIAYQTNLIENDNNQAFISHIPATRLGYLLRTIPDINNLVSDVHYYDQDRRGFRLMTPEQYANKETNRSILEISFDAEGRITHMSASDGVSAGHEEFDPEKK